MHPAVKVAKIVGASRHSRLETEPNHMLDLEILMISDVLLSFVSALSMCCCTNDQDFSCSTVSILFQEFGNKLVHRNGEPEHKFTD